MCRPTGASILPLDQLPEASLCRLEVLEVEQLGATREPVANHDHREDLEPHFASTLAQVANADLPHDIRPHQRLHRLQSRVLWTSTQRRPNSSDARRGGLRLAVKTMPPRSATASSHGPRSTTRTTRRGRVAGSRSSRPNRGGASRRPRRSGGAFPAAAAPRPSARPLVPMVSPRSRPRSRARASRCRPTAGQPCRCRHHRRRPRPAGS